MFKFQKYIWAPPSKMKILTRLPCHSFAPSHFQPLLAVYLLTIYWQFNPLSWIINIPVHFQSSFSVNKKLQLLYLLFLDQFSVFSSFLAPENWLSGW